MHGSHPSPSATPPRPASCQDSLRTLAPLDDGTDAPGLAERLLRAAPMLTDVHVDGRFRTGHSAWRGRLAEPRVHAGTLRLRGSQLVAVVDLNAVLAVSYCADASSSGFCLYDEEGVFLTLWSAQSEAFDAWLADTAGGYACRLARGGASQRTASSPGASAVVC